MEWDEKTLKLKGKFIHYYYKEDGNKPSMILLHGFNDNGLCYERVAEQFIEKYNVYMPDSKGHGQSSDPKKDFKYEDFVEDIYDLINHLKLEKVVLIGHSMGGAQAAMFSVTYPDKVKTLILEDPGFSDYRGSSFFIRFSIPFYHIFMPHRDNPKSLEKYENNAKKLVGNWSERDRKSWIRAKYEFRKHYPARSFKMLIHSPKGLEILPQINIPILLITAKKGLIRPSLVDKYKAVSSNLMSVYMEESGHNIRREQFEDEIKEIKKFLSNFE